MKLFIQQVRLMEREGKCKKRRKQAWAAAREFPASSGSRMEDSGQIIQEDDHA
jgi:hypothetical protein